MAHRFARTHHTTGCGSKKWSPKWHHGKWNQRLSSPAWKCTDPCRKTTDSSWPVPFCTSMLVGGRDLTCALRRTFRGFSLFTVAWAINQKELDEIRHAAGGAGDQVMPEHERPLEQRGAFFFWREMAMGLWLWGSS